MLFREKNRTTASCIFSLNIVKSLQFYGSIVKSRNFLCVQLPLCLIFFFLFSASHRFANSFIFPTFYSCFRANILLLPYSRILLGKQILWYQNLFTIPHNQDQQMRWNRKGGKINYKRKYKRGKIKEGSSHCSSNFGANVGVLLFV